MDNPIKDVTGNEAKHVLAQFLGQNLGELKKLDSDIIAGNPTLKGLNIDLNQIGTDIPVEARNIPRVSSPQIIAPPPPAPTNTSALQTVTVPYTPPRVEITTKPEVKVETDQFEFDFKLTPEKVYEKLDTITRQNSEILSILKELRNEANLVKIKKKN
jgi:hypothetical protein